MSEPIICDTSVWLYLGRLAQTALLQQLYTSVYTTETVCWELDNGRIIRRDTVDPRQLGWIHIVEPDERDVAWNRISDTYQPGVDYSDNPEYQAMRWYAQGHIFWMPFYYIDYAIAETGAMQLGLIDKENSEKAMETYLELCRMGGTKSVLDIFRSTGLRSPFEPELMYELMLHAADELGIDDYAAAA